MSLSNSDKAIATKSSRATVYVVTFVLASCSLLYELLIAQTVATLAANTVVWYSLTTGVYLASMGLGALAHRKKSNDDLWGRLFRVEFMLCVMGGLAVPVLHFAHSIGLVLMVKDLGGLAPLAFFVAAAILTVAIGLLTGLELPLLIDLGNAAGNQNVTNRVLAADYLGSLLAGLSFPLFFMPNFDLFTVSLLISSANLVVALFAIRWSSLEPIKTARRFSVSALLAVSLLSALFSVEVIEQYFVKKYYHFPTYENNVLGFFGALQNEESVFRTRSPYQTIDLLYDAAGHEAEGLIDFYSTKFIEDGKQPHNYMLFLNGDIQFVSNFEEYYHEYFAHVPIAVAGAAPRRVLVLGAGDGLLLRELIKYRQVEEIVHVDLDHKFVNLAKTHPVFLAMNQGAFDDPRVHTYFGDAYNYVRRSHDEFDAIYLDFPYVQDYNLSRLYSREFFAFVRSRLAPNGFVALDAPGLQARDAEWPVYVSTVSKAGFAHIRPYVSVVEDFNPSAFESLLESGVEPGYARFILAEHARHLRFEFVMAHDFQPNERTFLPDDVKRHVLTPERLEMTLAEEFPIDREINNRVVNSILRPTLPAGSIWEIRLAW